MENSFIILLKYLRKRSKLTIRELAKGLKVSESYLKELENGTMNPDELIIKSLITFYKLKPNEQRAIYDAAGKLSNSIPYDVIDFLRNNPNELAKVINNMHKEQIMNINNYERDELFYSDLVYAIKKLSKLEVTDDPETNKRIEIRLKDISEEVDGKIIHNFSNFRIELFDFAYLIGNKKGLLSLHPDALEYYKDLVEEEIKEIEKLINKTRKI